MPIAFFFLIDFMHGQKTVVAIAQESRTRTCPNAHKMPTLNESASLSASPTPTPAPTSIPIRASSCCGLNKLQQVLAMAKTS